MTVPTEFDVYFRLSHYLEDEGWTVVCASPPGGTDGRFRKCLLPRRAKGDEKGLRDEVDLTAHDGEAIILAECKPKLTDSLYLHNALGESDYAKLHRIADSFSPAMLSDLLRQATGLSLPSEPLVELVLAVGKVDCLVPSDITVVELASSSKIALWTHGSLTFKLA